MKSLHKLAVLSLACSVYLFAGSAPKEYPEGEVGRLVKLGEDIMNTTDTHPLTKDLVGNKLQCKSCHLAGDDGKPGTADGISSFIGTASAFPAWSGSCAACDATGRLRLAGPGSGIWKRNSSRPPHGWTCYCRTT